MLKDGLSKMPLTVCLFVCLVVRSAIAFERRPRKFIVGTQVHLPESSGQVCVSRS